MAYVEIQQLTKYFDVVEAVRDVSLTIDRGAILVLLGPSGSGKTTLLRLIAGFEHPDTGHIIVDGKDLTELPSAARRFGMVFQHYALFPHLSVFENVAFGLHAQRHDRAHTRQRVAAMLELVDLVGYDGRKIAELSGGQQQRVALARALAPEPTVLLLDEPLSNLDPALRERTRRELRQAIKRVGITSVFVTHGQDEAFEMGDHIAVIREGALEQLGTPDELYEDPRSLFVATFVGRANTLGGVVEQASSGVAPVGRVRVGTARWTAALMEALEAGSAVTIVVRPEQLVFVGEGHADAIAGEVTGRRYAGAVAYFTMAIDGGDSIEVRGDPHAAAVGDRVRVAPTQPVRAFA